MVTLSAHVISRLAVVTWPKIEPNLRQPIMTSTSRLTVRVAPSLTGIRAAADAFDAFQADHGLSQAAGWPVQVALDEVLSNIVRHGNAGRPDRFIEATFALVEGGLQLTVVDDGPELDPLARPDPDLTAPLEDRRPGGLGIHLIKHLCDRVEYTRLDRRNHLVLTFRGPERDPPERGKE
jgi:anti-sigma regulatory factor (Ser/Thr protein kinase)